LEDEHCLVFLSLLERAIDRYEVEIHGYSLMPNHYHLLLRSRHGNLSEAMQFINSRYTQRVNRLNRWDGPVFKGRFTSKLVHDESRLSYILAYIHLNPLRANLVTRIDSRSWTSLRAYLGRKGEPDWVTQSYFLELFDGSDALREYTLSLHRGGRSWPETMDLECGFFTDRAQEKTASAHGQPLHRSRFVEPERLLELVCEATGATLKEITASVMGPRANPARRFAVWALREHTRLKNREIAAHLNMTYNQVSNVLSRFRGGVEPMSTWIDELSILCVK
jgi:REP element-mobilizing transposase RayT